MKIKLALLGLCAWVTLLLPMQTIGNNNDGSIKRINVEIINQSDIVSIQFMREEEKLAHDVYIFYAEQYNVPIFRNISRSETAHQKAIMWLMNKYNIEDLSKEKAGEFNNRELQQMYDELTQATTLIDALKAGALIEEQDILDLENHLKKTDNADVKRVYTNLLRASENHLRAFSRNLSRRGVEYQPKILNLQRYSDIVK
ncbi:MAG: hypothetical protein BWZ00_01476 [Bacteroidetes bacterium ADurb.BinA174]|nr:MAG: hypothetical protein BWZ00_01476 [Bacteroidetes bacterium ADurb.BinA174]